MIGFNAAAGTAETTMTAAPSIADERQADVGRLAEKLSMSVAVYEPRSSSGMTHLS